MSNDLHMHQFFMRRCLHIAQNGLGSAAPNPMVGAVLARSGQIVAEGFHRRCGLPHAEVEAIGRVRQPSILKECTLYVNLEPCCHHGKTPPCTDLIIRMQIPRVVAAVSDPFGRVNGGGICQLRQNGIDVLTGVLEQEARTLNRRFFTFHTLRRPYVILKWAQTIDGFIDKLRPADAAPALVSGEAAHRLVHLWRTQEQAILIGANTALMDNPMLTARLCSGANPLRAVASAHTTLPPDLNIFNSEAQTLVLRTRSPVEMLNTLYQKQVQSVMVEGGAHLLQSFINEGLWDECRIFTSPQRFGEGAAAPRIAGRTAERRQAGGDWLEVLTRI